MRRTLRSWRARLAFVLGAAVVGGFILFGPSSEKPGVLRTGQAVVTAQPGQVLQARSVTLPLQPGGTARVGVTRTPPSAAKLAAIEEKEEGVERAMAARVAGLPASDPRVRPAVAPPASAASVAITAPPAAAPPQADADFSFFRITEIDPPAFGNTDGVKEPAVAQNGKNVFMAYNWFAARSIDGGTTFTDVDPVNPFGTAMNDFCCDQDVVYDKGRDRMYWSRLGIGDIDATANKENRVLVSESADGFVTSGCTAQVRASTFGINNGFLDYFQMQVSNNFLYMTANVFDYSNAPAIGGFVTHLVVRADLGLFASCTNFTVDFWTFIAGWTPALAQNAREIMYLGDQIVTNGGLNDQFRVYWIMDDNTALNSVDRTIAAYTFTNRNASCPVPGGANPCGNADQRVTGAVVEHNTPVPGNLGAAGDKVDFYWNVKEGNGFTLPYVESAGFFGNTIAYVQQKFAFSGTFTPWYVAAAADDREHVALSALLFFPTASGQQAKSAVAIDDDYNSNPPGWTFNSTAATIGTANWVGNAAGDYLRVRQLNPAGVGWVATGFRQTAGEYRPFYMVFGRLRDLNGFTRFDQK